MALDTYRAAPCPGCGGQLRQVAIGPATIDGCDACGGCWFDGEELKQVAALPGEPLEAMEMEFGAGLSASSGGGSGKCPRCKEPLQVKRLKQARDVDLDVCPSCGGMWLDEGELDALGRALPKRTGPMPPPHPAAERAAAVAGLLRTTICPHCSERNPELSERCSECGRPLHEAPRDGLGEIHSSHPLSWFKWLNEGLAWLAIPALCLWPAGPLESAGLSLGARVAVVLLLLALLGLRWLNKAYRIDAASTGLLLHKPVRNLFIPWSAIRSAMIFDTGTRSVFYPIAALLGGRNRYGYHGWGRGQTMDELMDDWLPQGVMVLYTTRGLVVINRDFAAHNALIAYVRERI